VEAARAWLRSRIDKGECDPIRYPERDRYLDVPPGVMDYWKENRSIPDWI
jgi:hypothetical protein